MATSTTAKHRLLFTTLSLTYIAVGILSTLPGASLLQLAHNTHVPIAVAGGMFALSAFGFLLGATLSGALTGRVKAKYLLILGLTLLSIGSVITAFTGSFPFLLLAQTAKGLGFGCIDISLNTIATFGFQENLSENLNNIHGMYGLGALLGPSLLALGLQFTNSIVPAYLTGMVIALCTVTLTAGQSIPEPPRQVTHVERDKTTYASETRTTLLTGLLWLMVIQIGFYAAAEIGFGNWIVTAVKQQAGISLALAAPVASAFFVGLTAGRLGGAQVLRHNWLSQTRLLYIALFGGAASGVLVALFPGQLLLVYSASTLVGFFYGPMFPSLMAITSRRFVHAVGPVTTVMMIGTGICGMIVPAMMGVLIPFIGMNWVMAIPTLFCLAVLIPMRAANRNQRTTLQSPNEPHTIEKVAEMPITQ